MPLFLPLLLLQDMDNLGIMFDNFSNQFVHKASQKIIIVTGTWGYDFIEWSAVLHYHFTEQKPAIRIGASGTQVSANVATCHVSKFADTWVPGGSVICRTIEKLAGRNTFAILHET